jgi:hypothetical protein
MIWRLPHSVLDTNFMHIATYSACENATFYTTLVTHDFENCRLCEVIIESYEQCAQLSKVDNNKFGNL